MAHAHIASVPISEDAEGGAGPRFGEVRSEFPSRGIRMNKNGSETTDKGARRSQETLRSACAMAPQDSAWTVHGVAPEIFTAPLGLAWVKSVR